MSQRLFPCQTHINLINFLDSTFTIIYFNNKRNSFTKNVNHSFVWTFFFWLFVIPWQISNKIQLLNWWSYHKLTIIKKPQSWHETRNGNNDRISQKIKKKTLQYDKWVNIIMDIVFFHLRIIIDLLFSVYLDLMFSWIKIYLRFYMIIKE